MKGSELESFMKKLTKEIMSGLRHGFFNFSLQCEVKNGKKRKLTFNAGKTHVYHIPEEECEE